MLTKMKAAMSAATVSRAAAITRKGGAACSL